MIRLRAKGPTLASAKDGRDAYELAIQRGFVGSIDDWLRSLKGLPGQDGSDALGPYELAVHSGFVGSEAEWLASLRGEKGNSGSRGKAGIQGPMGPMPEHRWEGTSLQFQQGPDGDTWGDLVNLQGPSGSHSVGGGVLVQTSGNSWFPGGW